MKKALFIAIVFISPYISVGQIVLDQTDLPQIGDVQNMLQVDSAQGVGLSPGASGENVIWNFSSLITGNSEDTTYYENPSVTLYGSSFPTSNIASKRWDSQENCYQYDYFIKGSSGMKWLGFGACWNTPPEIFISGNFLLFPLLTYSNSVNHSGRAVFDSISPNTYNVIYFTHISTADAWGTITTPSGTAQTIRIYSTETAYDSSYVSGVGTQNNVTTGYYYKWYEKDLGWPVLEIGKGIFSNVDDNIQYAEYAASLVSGINSIAYSDNSLSIYPNPNNGVFSIALQNTVAKSEVEIYNVHGEKVYAISNVKRITSNEIDLSKFPKGIYFVKIYDGDEIYTEKVVIQ
ncbi:MAG: T9SS type A sorting domain-containing protein [Bacteroidales bacterium]|nr:T9SS type A sorting domain-containing protein [Bacteroidales bacterium]